MSEAGITNENELFNLANKLNIHVDQIDTIDNIKRLSPKETYIILLRRDSDVGHWVAYNKGEYFDSFGQPPPVKIKRFVRKYNHKQYQSVDQNYCGWWCILFLYARQKKRPDLLDQMIDVSF